jgi:uncharacterized protein with beta-barrel porin domain
MNRIYRSVWSAARACVVVVHEKASAGGKPPGLRPLARCVATALLSLGAAPAMAADQVIDGATTQPYSIANGDSLTILATGSVIDATATLPEGVVAALGGSVSGYAIGAFSNAGSVIGNTGGVLLSRVTVAGSISNAGTIQAHAFGLMLSQADVAGGLLNSGTIHATYTAIALANATQLEAGVTNSGNVSALANALAVASGARLSGGVSNLGTLYAYGTAIDVGGTLSAGAASAGALSGGTLSGGITNTGTIFSLYGTAIKVASNGTLSGGITNAGLISGSPATGGRGVVIDDGASLDGGLINSGHLTGVSAAINVEAGGALAGGITNSGTIGALQGTGLVVASHATVTGGLTNSGVIIGGVDAVHVAAQGALDAIVVTGANTAVFIGDIDAPQTPLSVAAGATFSPLNALRVSGLTVDSGGVLNLGPMPSLGTLSPGISGDVTDLGTLAVAVGTTGHIQGNLTEGAAATYVLGYANGAQGQISVSGQATLLAGATITVDFTGAAALPIGQTLTGVIEAAGGLSANSVSVTANSYLEGFQAHPEAGGQALDLSAVEVATPEQALSATGHDGAMRLADTLQSIIVSPAPEMAALLARFEALPTAAAVADAVVELEPEPSPSAAVEQSFTDWLDEQVASFFDDHFTTPMLGSAASADAPPSDSKLWVDPFSSWANQRDSGGLPGYAAQTAGFALGGDRQLSPQVRLGLGLAYANSGVNGSAASSSARVNMYRVFGYGSDDLGSQLNLRWQADVGSNTTSAQRDIAFVGATANSSYRSLAAHGDVSLGRTYALTPTTQLEPSLSADYAWLRDAAYAESGAGALDLNVNAQTTQQLVVGGDARLLHALTPATSLQGHFGVGYDLLARQNTVTAAFAGDPGAAFTTPGPQPAPWVEHAGVELQREAADGVQLSAGIEAEHRSGFNNRGASVKLRWLF